MCNSQFLRIILVYYHLGLIFENFLLCCDHIPLANMIAKIGNMTSLRQQKSNRAKKHNNHTANKQAGSLSRLNHFIWQQNFNLNFSLQNKSKIFVLLLTFWGKHLFSFLLRVGWEYLLPYLQNNMEL